MSLQGLPFIVPSVLSEATSARAVGQSLVVPAQLAFFSQVRPVRLSVTVPSLLSVKRGTGQAAPAWISPSWPVPAQGTDTPPLL
jgi:hypothetical protein